MTATAATRKDSRLPNIMRRDKGNRRETREKMRAVSYDEKFEESSESGYSHVICGRHWPSIWIIGVTTLLIYFLLASLTQPLLLSGRHRYDRLLLKTSDLSPMNSQLWIPKADEHHLTLVVDILFPEDDIEIATSESGLATTDGIHRSEKILKERCFMQNSRFEVEIHQSSSTFVAGKNTFDSLTVFSTNYGLKQPVALS